MKLFLWLSCVSFINNCYSQVNYDQGLIRSIKPNIKLGDRITYEVKESIKIKDGIFTGASSQSKSIVTIEVVDTIKGYWLKYTVNNVESKNKNFPSQSIQDSLANGIKLYFLISKGGWDSDSNSYYKTKKRLFNELERIMQKRKFALADSLALDNLKGNISKKEGLEIFMKPLILFNLIYDRPIFKKDRTFYNGIEINILGHLKLPGLIEQKLLSYSPSKNSTEVLIKFTADRHFAANVNAPVYDSLFKKLNKNANVFIPDEMKLSSLKKYTLNLQTGYPIKITYSKVSKLVVKIESELEMNSVL